ncbi:MAG: alanine dehydrogenase [Alphaproteobacteria bacterium]|nr:alanine dehydrogenase [Alphaproteobacteria bacterium]
MLIGVPREIKNHEYRVGLTPGSVRDLVHHGHAVTVETAAGLGANFGDEDYVQAGAEIAPDAAALFAAAEMVVKVKEPQPAEFGLLREGQILFTYLHLAAEPEVARALIDVGAIGIAYETVTGREGSLPLLAPMSEVAGRMAVQVGAHYLEKEAGGRGVLLGGVPGVEAADVLVIGGGVSGTNAVRMAMGMEAKVTVLDRSLDRLRELDMQFGPTLNTIYSTVDAVERYALQSDLVIGAVLVPGAAAPKLLTADTVKRMRRGAVLVDIAIDQGGCFETSRPTTHDDPTYIVDEVVHYCVTNMPAAVARSSTAALNNATLPYVQALAGKGLRQALREDAGLCGGLSVAEGVVTHGAVAAALNLPLTDAAELLG